MRLLAYIQSLADRFLHRSRLEEDLEEELWSHIQHRADDLVRSGLDRGSAERQARVEFGGHTRFKEESRESVAGNVVETLLRDVRFSLRKLRKSPSFTVAAVVTLAMAVGANAVVFSGMNGLILRPLNLPDEESLYTLEHTSDKWSFESYPNYLDLRDHNRTFDGLIAYNNDQAWLNTGDSPRRVWLYEVSGNYLDVLGLQPYLGRFFHASDEKGPNSAPYVVLTYAYWHSHFQDDRGVLGRTVELNRHPFTIIGVAPPGFHGTLLVFSPDFFVPIVNQEQVGGTSLLNARANRAITVVGRLKAGVTPAQAIADLDAIGSSLEKTYPKDNEKMRFMLARPTFPGGDAFGDPLQAFLTGLLLLAGLILLAACANLGSLFAARAADRSREVALRLALGASRGRILRQLFTEAVLLSLIGGAVGIWGSVMLLHWLSAWQPLAAFPFTLPVNPDAKVYGVAVLLSVASGFLFGAVPVRQILRTDPYQLLKSASPTAFGRRLTTRDVLLAVQIAICAVLIMSSLVAFRGLERALHGRFGVEPRNALLVNTDLRLAAYRADQIPAMQTRMVESMKGILGVAAVGLVGQFPPLHVGWNDSDVFLDGTTDLRPSRAAAHAMTYSVSPDYFRAAGTALLSGRAFTWHDDANAPRVVVINQVFARKVFAAPTPIGRYYKLPDGTRIQVVGVVEDGKYTANLAENPQPAMFFPILQSPSTETWLVIRTSGDQQPVAAAIRRKLRDLDAGLPSLIQTWNSDMDGALFAPRMATVSLSVLGVIGAILAITGIFGTAAYSLSTRLRELGIRTALGAQAIEVLQAALGRAFKLLAFGSAAGLLLGLLASRVLAFIVYQATPRDPLVLAGVVLAMMMVGLLATWIPAQRALSVDALILLREE